MKQFLQKCDPRRPKAYLVDASGISQGISGLIAKHKETFKEKPANAVWRNFTERRFEIIPQLHPTGQSRGVKRVRLWGCVNTRVVKQRKIDQAITTKRIKALKKSMVS